MFSIHDDLYLSAASEQPIAVERRNGAHHARMMVVGHLDQLGTDSHGPPDRAWGEVVDAQVRPDSFLVLFQKVDQDLPRREFKVVRRRPRRVDPVNDRPVKGRAHVLGDEDGALSNNPWNESRPHRNRWIVDWKSSVVDRRSPTLTRATPTLD